MHRMQCLEGADDPDERAPVDLRAWHPAYVSLCQLTSAYVNVDFMIQKTNILRTKKRVPVCRSMPQYAAVCRSMPEDVHTAASQKTHSGATVPRPQRGLLHAPAGSLR
jgi:hypothetical protein